MSNRVRVTVTDDALYVANTGRPIDRQGVISISRQYLSTKGEAPPEDSFACTDGELVQAIREKRLRLYVEEPNDLKEHASQEVQTRRDYSGRALWELLQNADDAMAAEGCPSMELIGAKGLGFKSVLEVSERPEIHSGAFNFAFDPDRSAGLLKAVAQEPPRLVFRLPHAAKPDGLVRELRRGGFATVIKLPFKDDGAREALEQRLRTLPPHFMLLSQHMRTFEVQFRDGGVRRLVRQGGGLQAKAVRVLLKVEEDGAERDEEWRLWAQSWLPPQAGGKRLSAAIAVRMDGRVAAPAPDEVPLHVFYPTEESVLAPFLVHASFDLRTDRNHMLPGAHDDDLLGALGRLAKAVAAYLPPASVLELFRALAKPPPPNVKRLDRKIQRALGVAILETAFVPLVGGGRAKPADAATWAYDLPSVLDPKAKAVRTARLCAPELAGAFPALRAYGAGVLSTMDYAELLQHVACGTLDDCIKAAQVAEHACLSSPHAFGRDFGSLAKAPFWWTSDGAARPLHGARPLVRSRPGAWPAWLAADELDPGFAEAVLGSSNAGGKAWPPLVDGRLLQSADDLLMHCLAPAIRTWGDGDWARDGWEALATIQAWKPGLEWSKVRPHIPNAISDPEPARTALVRVVRVPRGADWVAAKDAYASPEIGGNPALADYFRGEETRHVIGMPTKARAFGRGGWRALTRWLGVSWEPKVRKYAQDAVGLTCRGRYRASIREGGLRYVRRDWFLDFFPECMAEVSGHGVANMLESLLPVVAPLGAAYLKQRGAERLHRPHPFASCADYQLRRETYLPCRRSLAHPGVRGTAEDLYWPETGIRGITPVLDLGALPLQRRQRLRAMFVSQLGIQEELPGSWEPWLDWADELAATVEAGGGALQERVVRGFYEVFLRRRFNTPKSRAVKQVVCTSSEGLVAKPARDAVWIDDARFASPEVLAALTSAGLALFPPMLDRGEKSTARLGVRCASDVVTVVPVFTPASGRETLRLENRLKARRRAFAALCEVKGDKWIDPAGIRAVHGLELNLAVNGAFVANNAAPAFADAEGWLVNLDAGAAEALAAACAHPFRSAADLRLWFTLVLKAASAADVAAILLDAGIPTYRLRDIELPDEPAEEEPPAAAATPAVGGAGQEGALSAGLGAEDAAGGAAREDGGDGDDMGGEEDDDASAGRADTGRSGGDAAGQQGSPPGKGGARPPRTPSGKLRKRPLYDLGERDASQGGGRTGRAAASAAAAAAAARGLAAEAWFARQLEASLPDGWQVQFNVRDDEVRESDVVLSAGDREWHVEIKCLTAERIYWSALELAKAQEHPDRYAMAFLVPVDGGFRVNWAWDPLQQLLACDRRIDWVWADTGQGPPLPKDSWVPLTGLKRPERPPNRMNFAIRVKEQFLQGLPQDDEALTQMWAQLAPPAVQAAE